MCVAGPFRCRPHLWHRSTPRAGARPGVLRTALSLRAILRRPPSLRSKPTMGERSADRPGPDSYRRARVRPVNRPRAAAARVIVAGPCIRSWRSSPRCPMWPNGTRCRADRLTFPRAVVKRESVGSREADLEPDCEPHDDRPDAEFKALVRFIETAAPRAYAEV